MNLKMKMFCNYEDDWLFFNSYLPSKFTTVLCFEYKSVKITISKDKLEPIRDVLDIILSWGPISFKKIKYKNVITKQDESFGV